MRRQKMPIISSTTARLRAICRTISQLTQKSSLLKDFEAVQTGNVWCTEKNMFQQTTGAADMIADLNRIVTGQADQTDQLTFLHRLK